jgi:hypothetical protein
MSDGFSPALVAPIVAVFVFLMFTAFAMGKRAAARRDAAPENPIKSTGYRSVFDGEPMYTPNRRNG